MGCSIEPRMVAQALPLAKDRNDVHGASNEATNTAGAGYLSEEYLRSLEEFGRPRYLVECGGWLLERTIPGTNLLDGMGCYPRFCCRDWNELAKDLPELAENLVSLTLVTDPFGNWTVAQLQQLFPERCFHFKTHQVVDLSRPFSQAISRHHRYYALRARRSVSVEICSDPGRMVNEWTELYSVLVQRHGLTGMKSFSHQSFEWQFQVPGLTVFRAVHQGRVVGSQLWFLQGDVVYHHLAACNDEGYQVGAAYALYWEALEFFSKKAHWADLGAGAGISETAADGLAKFKQGWANETRPVLFCGRILNRLAYQELARGTGNNEPDYFPAYRRGDFS